MLDIFKLKKSIIEPPYTYDFLFNLNEDEYPEYLKRIFKNITGKNLNLKFPKTFNEKIQWLKLYDSTPLKTRLTDKVLVRDYVKEKIGNEYLKPVLWVGKKFEDIIFETLPDKFIMKANNGCKWHYIVKNKEEYLNNSVLMDITKASFDGWMNQSFFPYGAFEMQYKDIKPQIIIEPLLLENISEKPEEIEIYCFNGKPRIFQKIKYGIPRIVSVFDEKYNFLNLKFDTAYILKDEKADNNLKLAVSLSKMLAEDFKLARVDWLIYKGKIYFNEITFTPFSGFYKFENDKWNYKLGKMLDLSK